MLADSRPKRRTGILKVKNFIVRPSLLVGEIACQKYMGFLENHVHTVAQMTEESIFIFIPRLLSLNAL